MRGASGRLAGGDGGKVDVSLGGHADVVRLGVERDVEHDLAGVGMLRDMDLPFEVMAGVAWTHQLAPSRGPQLHPAGTPTDPKRSQMKITERAGTTEADDLAATSS